jgi:hypothetical protein
VYGNWPSLHRPPYVSDICIALLSALLHFVRSDLNTRISFLFMDVFVMLRDVGKLNLTMFFCIPTVRLYLFISEKPKAVYFD